jgi:hypothetical protein
MCCNKNLTLFSGLTGPSGDYTIVTTEAPGVNCANGGVKIELFNGLTNALISTSYACNGINGTDSPDADVLLYEARIKDQVTTSAPDDDQIMIDTIEGVWSRVSTGSYRYTKSAAFAVGTTFFTFTNGLPTTNQCRLEVASSNYVSLKTYDATGTLADDILQMAYISIKIRP